MQLTAAERLLWLKLTQTLEIIEPSDGCPHDADTQALELGKTGASQVYSSYRYRAPTEPIRAARPRQGHRATLKSLLPKRLAERNSPRAIHRDM